MKFTFLNFNDQISKKVQFMFVQWLGIVHQIIRKVQQVFKEPQKIYIPISQAHFHLEFSTFFKSFA